MLNFDFHKQTLVPSAAMILTAPMLRDNGKETATLQEKSSVI